MFRTQLYLTDAQHERLKRLARSSGRSRSALLREAVDRLLTSEAPPSDWKDRLRQARGMWKEREDLDEIMGKARRSMDRSLAAS
jgi:Arc/MetJ-type ribon-helix-helix transcriptional regulator